jgi:hypothetical protein
MNKLILGLRWWAKNWPAWPWLDRKMGMGPGHGLTLLMVALAVLLPTLLQLVPWAIAWFQRWGLVQ